MRGLETSVNKLRRQIFVEIARVAFESDDVAGDLEAIPYKITPTEEPKFRESIYRERAIASERVRLAMGMSMRPQDRPVHITSGLNKDLAEQYYAPPLMQVIPSACEKCATNDYKISDQCSKCMARSCVAVCPVNAVFVGRDGRSEIDQEKCIRCGRCKSVCPYDAIVHRIRPCARACGVNAVESDQFGRAYIDPKKCVACGQCMVNCPFGAIADKSQIFQLIRTLKRGDTMIAEIAPAIIGQFGENVSLGQIMAALKKLGFSNVYEVALGADDSVMDEAEKYVKEIATGKESFLLTSCCTSWRMLVERQFPQIHERVSSTLTPMVATARYIKKKHQHAKVVFIGPCAAKKLEAIRSSVRGDVDFVITFEELAGIFEARGIVPATCNESNETDDASAAGRGFAVSGGVAQAIEACIKSVYPETEVKTEHVESLSECKKLLSLAAHGKKNGYLLEGMACPGGCVAGAGVNLPVNKGRDCVLCFTQNTKKKVPN